MGDWCWWKTHRDTQTIMMDRLAELAQELGRLPTEEEACQRVVIYLTSDYPDYAALMRRIAGRLGRYVEWVDQLRELERLETQKRQKEQALSVGHCEQQMEPARVWQAKQRERLLWRQRDDAERRALRQAQWGTPAKQPQSRVTHEQQTQKVAETIVRAVARTILPIEAAVTKVDLSEVTMMPRRISDRELYDYARKALQRAGDDLKTAVITRCLDELAAPTYATMVRRLGPHRDWPEAIARAVEQGILPPLPAEAEVTGVPEATGSSELSEPLGPIAPPVAEELTPEVIEVSLVGRAQLEIVWQGRPLQLRLTLGRPGQTENCGELAFADVK